MPRNYVPSGLVRRAVRLLLAAAFQTEPLPGHLRREMLLVARAIQRLIGR
jgi:hypothetical protein